MSLDLTVFVVCSLFGGIGIARGFVRQVWNLGLLVVLLWFRPWNIGPVMEALHLVIPQDLPAGGVVRAIVGFFVLYLVGIGIGWLVIKFFIRQTPVIDEMDRLAGLALGLAVGGLLSLGVAWTAETIAAMRAEPSAEPTPLMRNAQSLRVAGPLNPWLLGNLRTLMHEPSTETDEARVNQLKEYGAWELFGTVCVGQDRCPRAWDVALDPQLRSLLARPEIRQAILGTGPRGERDAPKRQGDAATNQ